MVKVVVCWTGISGYMCACWRALAREEGIELFVIAWDPGSSDSATAFGAELMAGIRHRLLNEQERNDEAVLAGEILKEMPDVLFVGGWAQKALRRIVFRKELEKTRIFMGMDTPWRGTMRQKLARLQVGKYVDRMDKVVVAGERAWQFARNLGVGEEKLIRGVYGMDFEAFSKGMEERLKRSDGWPRTFLYVGRYVEEKGLDVLLEAYGRYRAVVKEPWGLFCCGRGPLAGMLKREGVTDLGFVQPSDQPEVFSRHGVMVMPSRFEPWGVAIAEGVASGLPVICTEACGASIDVVKSQFNGLVAATENVGSLLACLVWMHEHYEELPMMGKRGQGLAEGYGAEFWTRRIALAAREGKA